VIFSARSTTDDGIHSGIFSLVRRRWSVRQQQPGVECHCDGDVGEFAHAFR
jgi:hypothetical protein